MTRRSDSPIRADLEVAARIAALFGCVAMLIASANLLVLAAGLIGVVFGLTGFRRIRTDLDGAAMSLGIALLISTLTTAGSVAAGGGLVGIAGLLAVVLFSLAWTCTERLRGRQRQEWGRRQRDVLVRRRELQERQDELRARRVPPDAP